MFQKFVKFGDLS